MWQRLFGKMVVAAVCAGWLVGCRSASERRPYARDPLLISKRAVEGTAGREAPIMLALAEPVPPALPPNAYVALPPATRLALHSPEFLALADPEQAADLGPKSVAPQKHLVVAIPVARAKRTLAYGHDADYSWIQGIVERADSGQWLLRYCESLKDDPWGGKAILKHDARLRGLRVGDALKVEGEIIAPPTSTVPLPLYEIREVVESFRLN